MHARSNSFDLEENSKYRLKQHTNHMMIRILTAKNRSEVYSIMMCNFLNYSTAASSEIHGRQKIYMQAIEAIQRTFTNKINEVQYLIKLTTAEDCKKSNHTTSLLRRREWYLIIYIWNQSQHTLPNIDGIIGHKITTRNNPRHGPHCVIEQ